MALVCHIPFIHTGTSSKAESRVGKFSYNKSFGKRSVRGERGHEPFDVDAVLNLASCTKLLTTVAALQCVDRGLISLDEDITRILPEFSDIEILIGFDDRTRAPVLVKSKSKLTLRFVLPLCTLLTALSSPFNIFHIQIEHQIS